MAVLVGEAELGAGAGSLAAHDHARAVGPAGAHEKAKVGVGQIVGERLRGGGRAGPHDDLGVGDDLAGQLLQRQREQRDVVGRGVGSGVAGPRQAGLAEPWASLVNVNWNSTTG
jgi:hypothetical protein